MRRFRSTLQALLTVRQRQERLAMERYSEALRARQKAVAALAASDQERRLAGDVLNQRLSTGVQAAEALSGQLHYRTLESRREAAQQALVTAENAIAPALQAMLHAKNQREAVEECIERQRERHRRDQEYSERKLLDELAQRRTSPVRAFAGSD
ncbi:MAG: flagellar export protein FliJ [Limisphaerales bacterium]